jgi:hypothetical protein
MRAHGIVDWVSVFRDVEIFLDDTPHVGEERPVSADSAAIFIRLDYIVGANLATGQKERREFASGPTLTANRMVDRVKALATDWKYDHVTLGYPGPVVHNRPVAEPHNLGPGWVGFGGPGAETMKLLRWAALSTACSWCR